MKNKYVFVLVMLLTLSILSFGIAKYNGTIQEENDEKLFVTSLYPIYIGMLNITDGVSGVRVKSLTQPVTGCIHDYQLTTQDMLLLEEADAFIINGAGMETYLDDVLKVYPGLFVVDSSAQIEFLESDAGHSHDHHGHEEDEKAHPVNSHIWLDVNRYRVQIENIARGLCEADPANKEQYLANKEVYLEKLEVISGKCQEVTKQYASYEKPNIISTHEAFSYFVKNFDFEITHTVNMDENTALHAATVSECIEAAMHVTNPIVFAEEMYGNELSKTLEEEAGCKTLMLDTLVSGKINKNAYINGMLQNINTIMEVMGSE